MQSSNGSNTSTAPSRAPLVELLAIAAPSVATMVSYPLKQFIDTWMVGRLGPTALAAAGNGGVAAWAPIAAVTGILTVINTYVAQNLGADRPERGPAYAWAGLWISLTAAAALVAATPLLGPLFALTRHTPELQALEVRYAQIMLWGAFFPLAARGLAQFFYGMHRPVIVLVATVIGNAVNLLANYALIFGKWGAPALGVEGAAIGTVLGGAVEFTIPFVILLTAKHYRDLGAHRAWRISTKHLRDIWRIGWPGGLQMANEMICWAIFMTAIVGYFSTADQAAGWIALRYMTLSFMPTLGLSFAITAVVGRHIGRGDPDTARHRALLGVKLALAYMGGCALLMVVFREPAVLIFMSDEYSPAEREAILRIGKQIMICAAAFQVFDALGISLIGALRGAGDTVWPGVVTMILSWSVIIGGGLLFVVFAPGLGGLGPWIAAAVYIVLFGLAMSWRFSRGNWRSVRLAGERGGPEGADRVAPGAGTTTPGVSAT